MNRSRNKRPPQSFYQWLYQGGVNKKMIMDYMGGGVLQKMMDDAESEG